MKIETLISPPASFRRKISGASLLPCKASYDLAHIGSRGARPSGTPATYVSSYEWKMSFSCNDSYDSRDSYSEKSSSRPRFAWRAGRFHVFLTRLVARHAHHGTRIIFLNHFLEMLFFAWLPVVPQRPKSGHVSPPFRLVARHVHHGTRTIFLNLFLGMLLFSLLPVVPERHLKISTLVFSLLSIRPTDS